MYKMLPLILMTCLFFAACGDDDEAAPDGALVDQALPDGGGPALDGLAPDGPAPPREIQLPADEAPHQDPVEWWYYTGRLQTEGGDIYGFEAVIFQMMMIPGKPLYISNAALTDLSGGRHILGVETTADTQPTPQEGFDLQVGTMRLMGHGGKDRVEMEAQGIELELDLQALKPAVIQYGTGHMTIGADAPFYYYSYTRMSASGALIRDGQRIPVSGEAWMDHQWGDIGREYGWDWFSVRFDDDTELMLFIVKRPDKEGFLGGTYIAADGASTPLQASDFTVTAKGSWLSPETDITYSHGWRLQVPSLSIDVDVDPLMADQEFNGNIVGAPIYWEGLCGVEGTRGGAALGGHAYVELTADNF